MKEKRKMSRKRGIFIIIWLILIAVLLAAVFIAGPAAAREESISEVMRDGVLHDRNRIEIFGLSVNPGLVSAYIVTALLLVLAALFRIFAFPRFSRVPGRFQAAVEWAVGFFSDMADKNSPSKPRFAGAYIFSVGSYVFFGTLFELLGLQVRSSSGMSVTLPAPLSDINGAIAVGVTSFIVILSAGIIFRGGRGALSVLKDFSLPVSMSFRLFGALLSGLLVTELVYYNYYLSFALPVLIAVLFTLLHALIQTFVFATLVSVFYGEASDITKKPERKGINKKGTLKK